MACEARAARGSLIYILEMISLRIEPRNFEDYLYITISFVFLCKPLSSNIQSKNIKKILAICQNLKYN